MRQILSTTLSGLFFSQCGGFVGGERQGSSSPFLLSHCCLPLPKALSPSVTLLLPFSSIPGFNATLSVHVPSFVTYKAQKPKSDSPKLRRQSPPSPHLIICYLILSQILCLPY